MVKVFAARLDHGRDRHRPDMNAALHTTSSWPLKGSPTCWPVAASQIRAVLSQEAVTISFPLGLKAASMRTSRPLITPIGRPLAASQICAVLSPDAVTMRVPSGLNATPPMDPLWPSAGRRSGRCRSVQICATESSAPVTTRFPSGLNAAASIQLLFAILSISHEPGRGTRLGARSEGEVRLDVGARCGQRLRSPMHSRESPLFFRLFRRRIGKMSAFWGVGSRPRAAVGRIDDFGVRPASPRQGV